MTRRSLFGAFLAALLAPLARWFGEGDEAPLDGRWWPGLAFGPIRDGDLSAASLWRRKWIGPRRFAFYRVSAPSSAAPTWFRPGDRVAFVSTLDDFDPTRTCSYSYEIVESDERSLTLTYGDGGYHNHRPHSFDHA